MFALAIGGVVAGAPLFAAGRRAIRLRQALATLEERPLVADTVGLAAVRGRVVLEGPMFAPLSGRPCAGFTLEATGEKMRVGAVLHELRPFRLQGESASARIVADHARLGTEVTAERLLTPGDALPQRLSELLGGSAELRWLLDRRVPIRLVERALEVGSEVVVTGMLRPAQAVAGATAAVASEGMMSFAATGTDGAVWSFAASAPTGRADEPSVWVEASDPLERLEISTRVPTAAQLAPPSWQSALVVAGPLLMFAGLGMLAALAGPLLQGRY
jgi:hypothetical protein